MYSLTVLEPKSLQSRSQRTLLSLRNRLLPCFSLFPVGAHNPWCSLACSYITAVSASIWLLLFCMHPVSLCLSPRKTLLIGLRAYWIIQHGLLKSWSFTYICKDPFFIKGCIDRFLGGPDVFEWPLFQKVIRKSQENEGGSGGLRTHRKK